MGELVKRSPPTIVPFGKREIISTAQLNVALVCDKIIREGVNDWIAISDLAKFVYGRSFLANNRRVRAAIWRIRRALLGRGFFLIHEGRPVEHLKIYDAAAELDRQLARPILRQMRTRTDFSAELYEKAEALIGSLEQPPAAISGQV